jgi:PPM family protein phosphatase
MTTDDIVRIARSPRSDCASDAAFVREAVFATRGTRLYAAVASSRGQRHAVNEDGHSTLDGTAPLFVVADGVSSGAMASRASGDLVAHLHAALGHRRADADAVKRAVLDADREIARSIARRTDAPGAATLALCAATDSTLSRWLVAWVGDCRVYRVGPVDHEPAELLTRDDTYRHLDEASPPGGSPDDPARMIGNGAVDAPNVRQVALRGDEMLVLCSDGVHRHADPSDIGRLLRGSTPLARRCVKLVEFVRARGSHDDATVLAVHRSARPRARFARAGLITALLALAAGAIVGLAADSEAAPGLALQGESNSSQVK